MTEEIKLVYPELTKLTCSSSNRHVKFLLNLEFYNL